MQKDTDKVAVWRSMDAVHAFKTRRTTSAAAGVIAAMVTVITLVPTWSEAAPSNSGGATWSTPVRIEPPSLSSSDSSIYGVSCPNANFCAAVDARGYALFWDNGMWSRPQPVGAGGTLTSVSCPTTTHCIALSAGGKAVLFSGRAWSLPKSIGPVGTYKLSCPTVTFCAFVSAGGSVGAAITIGIYNGRSWATQQIPSDGAHNDRILDVSCATPRFCIAANLNGHSLTFDGRRWVTTSGTGPIGMISVSCGAVSRCIAVTDAGTYATFDGSRWSDTRAIPDFAGAFGYSVSCSSTTRCTAIGLNGRVVNWQSGRWSKTFQVFPGGELATVDVSCSPQGGCMAVDSKGDAAVRAA